VANIRTLTVTSKGEADTLQANGRSSRKSCLASSVRRTNQSLTQPGPKLVSPKYGKCLRDRDWRRAQLIMQRNTAIVAVVSQHTYRYFVLAF
jgi:hypothetical protein